jgi:hypothetical protein
MTEWESNTGLEINTQLVRIEPQIGHQQSANHCELRRTPCLLNGEHIRHLEEIHKSPLTECIIYEEGLPGGKQVTVPFTTELALQYIMKKITKIRQI